MRYGSHVTETERNILETLIELEREVASMPTANPKPDLLPLFTKLDDLAGHMPRGTDPMLLHYLQKKSYQKARLLLEGRDSENQAGNCGHV